MKHPCSGALAVALMLICGAAGAVDGIATPGFDYQFSTGAGGKGRNRGDAELRIVRRAHTGRAAGAQVLIGVLAGGAVGFRKNQLHGERIKAMPNPGADALQTALRAEVHAWQARNPELELASPVVVHVSGGDWVLMYQSLDKSPVLYELRYSTQISVRGRSSGAIRKGTHGGLLRCTPTPVVQDYPAWTENDFAGVRAVQADYVAECARQFAGQLPGWLGAEAATEAAMDRDADTGSPASVEGGNSSHVQQPEVVILPETAPGAATPLDGPAAATVDAGQ